MTTPGGANFVEFMRGGGLEEPVELRSELFFVRQTCGGRRARRGRGGGGLVGWSPPYTIPSRLGVG